MMLTSHQVALPSMVWKAFQEVRKRAELVCQTRKTLAAVDRAKDQSLAVVTRELAEHTVVVERVEV